MQVIIEPARLARDVSAHLARKGVDLPTIEDLGDSGFRAVVDGEHCLSSVHVWPDGSGYSEYLFVRNAIGGHCKTQVASQADATAWALEQVLVAVARATIRGGDGAV